MSHPGSSSLNAFDHEPVRRGVVNDTTPQVPQHEREAGLRLMRGPGNPRDRALSSLGQRWVDALPAHLQPQAMVQAYPRIANRLALCWTDPALREMLFADLLGSRRRGRRGFPAAVDAELVALLGYAGKDRRAQDPARIL